MMWVWVIVTFVVRRLSKREKWLLLCCEARAYITLPDAYERCLTHAKFARRIYRASHISP